MERKIIMELEALEFNAMSAPAVTLSKPLNLSELSILISEMKVIISILYRSKGMVVKASY